MKIILLFSALIFLLTPKAFAEIKEGKSTVNTSVTTNVNSSSSNSNNTSETKTHIEIEVNGEKKVLDTKDPGTHTLSIEKDGGKSSATVKVESNANSSNSEENEENEEEIEDLIDDDGEVYNKTIIQKIIAQIKDFFANLFNF